MRLVGLVHAHGVVEVVPVHRLQQSQAEIASCGSQQYVVARCPLLRPASVVSV